MDLYYRYLDSILLQSKFKIPILKKGRDLLVKKFPFLEESDAIKILINWFTDTNPYDRLRGEQFKLF